MTKKEQTKKTFRKLLNEPGIIRSLGAHDALSAAIIEQAGFETVFVGGFGATASSLGLPDLSYIGLSEMADVVRRISSRVSVPVIADGDTGHGDLHNVQRTIREFETAGAAGIILEDQVFPKRCGHFEGQQVVSKNEMVLKIKAAIEAKDDSDFAIIARTDARSVHDVDTAIDRINAYCEAGADIAFIEAPKSMEELEAFAKRVPYPKFVNMLAFGKTPILSAKELEEMGFKIVVAPIASVLMTANAIQELTRVFQKDGHTQALEEKMVSFDEIKEILGVDSVLSLRSRL